jgi:hypothetical protein
MFIVPNNLGTNENPLQVETVMLTGQNDLATEFQKITLDFSGPRTCSVNGWLAQDKQFFYVPRTTLEDDLIQKIGEKALIVISGSRASGKSTILHRLQQSPALQNYQIIWFSSLDVLDEEKFWKGNTQFLANQNISCELNKSSDLRNLFLGPGTLGRKKRLIFWDEFDSLLTNPNLWNQVLQALREIHEFHKAEPNSLFQSIICVGAEKVKSSAIKRDLSKPVFGSPFNTKVQYDRLAFTLEETRYLFAQITLDYNRDISDDIITYTHTLTSGHAGMINICGRYLIDYYFKKGLDLTFNIWKLESVSRLFIEMGGVGAFTHFIDSIRELPDPEKTEVTKRLENLSTPGVLQVQNLDIDESIAHIGLGELKDDTTSGVMRLWIKNPLVKVFLRYKLFQKPLILEFIPTLQPMGKNKNPPDEKISCLQISEVLKVALQYFSPQHISDSFSLASKLSQVEVGIGIRKGDAVPKEAVYQAELFTVLLDLMGPSWTVINEAEVPSTKKSLDIYLLRGTTRIALELVASTTDADIEAHAERGYGQLLQATEFILHFTPARIQTIPLMYQTRVNSVEVLHIYHSQDGKEYEVFGKGMRFSVQSKLQ